MSSTAGEFITETLEYDGGRQVSAYVPAAAAEAVVFAGDGQSITSWGEALEAADLPPTMIIGAHRVEDETLRLHEYSPGRSTAAFAFDPQRFAAHETFFVEDVRRWAATRLAVRLPACRTAVFGVSAGAELALAMGLRHPGQGTARPPYCPAGFRVSTSSPAPRNRSSSPTRPSGRTRYARRVGTLSWPNGPARTATPSGNTSFR
jgi:pimeloyl-ACP methyl ester carboxylesterase